MTKRNKSLAKSSSRSSSTMPAGIRPQSLRKLEKALANLGHAPEASFPVDDDPGETPLERAQDLIYQAWEIPNPAKRISLATQALKLCPDCADAHMLLAEEQSRTPEDAIERFQRAVDAGERALGPEPFKQDVGYFWGLLGTRPYMRARLALAQAQWSFGERSIAIANAQDLLRLNPNDNQGVRHILMNWFLQSHRLPEARALWKLHEEDGSAVWAWSRALMDFIEHGDRSESNAALDEAIACNPHVAPLLLGREPMPVQDPEFVGRGDRNEAVVYVLDNLDSWQQADGALRWLSRAVPTRP